MNGKDQDHVTLTVNGELRSFPPLGSVAELLDHLGLDARQGVVQPNRRLVRRPEPAATDVGAWRATGPVRLGAGGGPGGA